MPYDFIQNLRILDKCAFAYCKIGIRGSTATSYKNLSTNSFNLENALFIKSMKNKSFTQITVCSIVTHLYHPELKSGAFINHKQKKKNLYIPYTARKRNKIFIKKSQNTAFWLNMRNSQQVCIWINKDRSDKFRSNQNQK